MDKARLLLLLAYRNIWRNPRRSLITLFAITMGVWSSAMLSTLARGISWGMADDAIRNLTGHIQITAPEYLSDPVIDHSLDPSGPLLLSALASGEVVRWSPRIRLPGVVMSERESFAVTLVGIDPERERGLSFIGEGVQEGTFLANADDTGIVIGERLRDLLHTEIGRKIAVLSEGSDNTLKEQGYRIRGTFSAKLQSTEQSYVFLGLKTLQEMLKLGGEVSEISLLVRDKEHISSEVSRIRQSAEGLVVSPWTALQPFIVALLDIQSKFISFWFVIVFVAVSFGIVNTLLMAIMERTREIGLLQALGMRPGAIVGQIIFESFFLVLFGAIAGNLIATLTVYLLSGGVDIGVFAKGAEYVGASRIVYPVVILEDWIRVNVIVAVMGILSSVYPAWRAGKLRPVEALQRG